MPNNCIILIIKFAWFLVTLASLSGCTTPILAGNCIDAQFERKPVEKSFIFSIENIKTGKTETRKILCKGTYSAQCSVRGNGWHWSQINKPEPYQIKLSPNEKVEMVLPACGSFVDDKVEKKRRVINLEDGRRLHLNYVYGKTDDIRHPLGYKSFYDPDNEYIYYLIDDKKKKRTERKPWDHTTKEGIQEHYMSLNIENSKRPSFVVPLNFSFEEL